MDERRKMTDNRHMTTRTEIVKISEGGRIVIPAAFRKELGLQIGDDVVLEMDHCAIRLSTRREGLTRARETLGKYLQGDPSPVEEFIAERHAEAARE